MNSRRLKERVRRALGNAPIIDFRITRTEDIETKDSDVKLTNQKGISSMTEKDAVEQAELFAGVNDEGHVQLGRYKGTDPPAEVSVGTPAEFYKLLKVAYLLRAKSVGLRRLGIDPWKGSIRKDYKHETEHAEYLAGESEATIRYGVRFWKTEEGGTGLQPLIRVYGRLKKSAFYGMTLAPNHMSEGDRMQMDLQDAT